MNIYNFLVSLWAVLDCDRWVGSPGQTKTTTFFSVILVTHPKSYIETTDRRDFGGKPSMWRWGWVLVWKI